MQETIEHKVATDNRFIPHELGVIPFVDGGIGLSIQIPGGEKYICGTEGVYIVTGMKVKDIKEMLEKYQEDYKTPKKISESISILSNGLVCAGFGIPVSLNHDGTPVVQYNRNREFVEHRPIRRPEYRRTNGRGPKHSL